jgi:hypothetical protein
MHVTIQNLSYISYSFIYFHEKGLFQCGVNASQMSYFHVTSKTHTHTHTHTELRTALFCVITRPVVDHEDGTDRVSRKVGKELPQLAA